MLSRVRWGNRALGAAVVAVSMLLAVPAAGQAATTATSAPGISAAGTVPGIYNGNPVTVQLATVQNCASGTSTFVAMWAGGTFRETPASASDACDNYDSSAQPQTMRFSGFDAAKDALSKAGLEGPASQSPDGASVIRFTITTAGGTLVVAPHTLGPLQGAPGRVQPFGTAALALRLVTQPSNTPIFQPLSPPVQVEFIDSDGHVVSSSAPITLAFNKGAVAGTLTKTEVGDVATFSDLQIEQAGVGYTMSASSPAATGATSNPFNASWTRGRVCNGSDLCTSLINTIESQVSVTWDPGNPAKPSPRTQSISADVGQPLSCAASQYGGYTGSDPNWYGFSIDPSADRTVTYDLFAVPPDNVQFCFGASSPFVTAAGGNAAFAALPDGSPGFVGVLPTCDGPDAPGPCVRLIDRLFEGDTFFASEITVVIPQALSKTFGHA